MDWDRPHIRWLNSIWDQQNTRFFSGQLPAPVFSPHAPRVAAAGGAVLCPVPPAGPLVWIDPGWVMRPGRTPEGTTRLAADLILHEQVHVFTWAEGTSHGPSFASKCSEIGATLGLPPVTPATCRTWPVSLRAPGFYGLTPSVSR